MQSLGGVTVIGPVIDGLANPVQIVQMGPSSAISSTMPRSPPMARSAARDNPRR
jgi:hypothetical protein